MHRGLTMLAVLAVLTVLTATCAAIHLTEDQLTKMLAAKVKDPTLSTQDIIEASLGATVATPVASSINEGVQLSHGKMETNAQHVTDEREGSTLDRLQVDAAYDAGGTTLVQIAFGTGLAAGCYVKTPSGCPAQSSFSATDPTRDTVGEQHRNAAEDQNACLQTRKSEYDAWCGASDTVMQWVAPDGGTYTTSPEPTAAPTELEPSVCSATFCNASGYDFGVAKMFLNQVLHYEKGGSKSFPMEFAPVSLPFESSGSYAAPQIDLVDGIAKATVTGSNAGVECSLQVSVAFQACPPSH